MQQSTNSDINFDDFDLLIGENNHLSIYHLRMEQRLVIAHNECLLTKRIEDYLISHISPFNDSESDENNKKKYEVSNVLEHMLVSMANLKNVYSPNNEDKDQDDRSVYKNLSLSHPIHQKFASEISRKMGCTKSTAYLIVGRVIDMISGKTKFASGNTANLETSYKFQVTPRISYLLSKYPDENVKLSLLNSSIFSTRYGGGGQHWGLTQYHFDKLYEYGVRFEGFSLPSNSRFLGKSGTFIGTLFPCDGLFQSLGNFFEIDENKLISAGGHLQVNPPFIESILSDAAKKCISILSLAKQKGINLKIFFHGPAWSDAEFFKTFDTINTKDFDKIEVRLRKGNFYIEKPNGEVILSSVDNYYFCLSSFKFTKKEQSDIETLMSKDLK